MSRHAVGMRLRSRRWASWLFGLSIGVALVLWATVAALRNWEFLVSGIAAALGLACFFPQQRRGKSHEFCEIGMNITTSGLTTLLLGSPLYSDKRVGLRELIQNAIDACRIRQELVRAGSPPYKPEISIVLDPAERTACVKDNGIGMSADIVREYLLNVGRSYYSSAEFKSKGIAYRPIGRFGVGFLSCFLLSEKIAVRTRYFSDSTRNDLEIRKDGTCVAQNAVEDTEFQGTEVILNYEQFMSAFGSEAVLKEFLRSSFLSHGVNLTLKIRHTDTIQITGASDYHLDVGALQSGIRQMRISGVIDEFTAFVRQHMRTLSNRDLANFDEKHAKVMLLTLFQLGGFYLVQSEVETDNGYIDILLTAAIQHKEAVKFDWLIELKYLKVSERKRLSITINEGLAQLTRYAESRQIRESLERDRLQKVLLTFVGKNEVHQNNAP